MPLDAPVMTMTCSSSGFSVSFMSVLQALRTGSVSNAVKERGQTITDAGRQRLGRWLLHDAERAALVEDLRVRSAGAVPPEPQRGGRIRQADAFDDDLRQPCWKHRIDEERLERCNRLEAEQRVDHEREGARIPQLRRVG